MTDDGSNATFFYHPSTIIYHLSSNNYHPPSMSSFAHRSTKKELLDGVNIPFADIRRNMQELDFINRHLGGHAITIKGLTSLIKHNKSSTPIHILEIGCGGGGNLQAIKRWASRHGQQVRLSGVDYNKECIAFARSKQENKGIGFIHSDYRDLQLTNKPDIIFSSLFCHHFSNEELAVQLRWMQQHSSKGFFINDLHRHPLAWASIKALTGAFSKSYLVKNDAPLSVLRGFVKRDWQTIFRQANLASYNIQWRWAFRWLVTYRHDAA